VFDSGRPDSEHIGRAWEILHNLAPCWLQRQDVSTWAHSTGPLYFDKWASLWPMEYMQSYRHLLQWPTAITSIGGFLKRASDILEHDGGKHQWRWLGWAEQTHFFIAQGLCVLCIYWVWLRSLFDSCGEKGSIACNIKQMHGRTRVCVNKDVSHSIAIICSRAVAPKCMLRWSVGILKHTHDLCAGTAA